VNRAALREYEHSPLATAERLDPDAPGGENTSVSVRRRVFWGTLIASVFLSFDMTIVNVALPQIQGDLGGGIESAQWVTSVYALTYGIMLIPSGRLIDLIGSRRVFIGGLLLDIVASAVAGASTTPTMLIGARALQGVGAAAIAPAGSAMIARVYAKGQRGAVYGIIGAALGAAAGIGPAVGGLVIQALDWRWVFFMNVPFGLVAMTLMWLAPRTLDPPKAGAVDLNPVGTLLFAASVLGVNVALIESGRHELIPFGLVALTVSAMAGYLMARHERNRAEPIIQFSLLKNRVVAGCVAAKFAINFCYFGTLLYLVLYLQGTLGFSPFVTGLFLLPGSLAAVLLSPWVGKKVEGTNPKYFMVAGLGAIAFSMFLYSLFDSTTSVFWHLMPAILLNGIGFAIVSAPTRIAPIDAVEPDMRGRVSSMLSTAGKLASGFGVAFTAGLFHRFKVPNATRAVEARDLSGTQFTADDIAKCLGVDDLTTHLGGLEKSDALLASHFGKVQAAIDQTFVWTFQDVALATGLVAAVFTLMVWLLFRGQRESSR
jgi:EmrB/QacA subfamily drug resistance transporter